MLMVESRSMLRLYSFSLVPQGQSTYTQSISQNHITLSLPNTWTLIFFPILFFLNFLTILLIFDEKHVYFNIPNIILPVINSNLQIVTLVFLETTEFLL